MTITVSQARANLRAVLDRVKSGEEVVLTQNGEPVAVLVHPSQLGARRASPLLAASEDRLEQLREARDRKPDRGAGLSAARARRLVADIRAARDHR
jgi:prevent-host-death family protein